MKKLILFLIIGFILNNPGAYSQTTPGKVSLPAKASVPGKVSISGKVSVSGFSKDGTIKEQTPVELFKSFKESKYKIGFVFAGWGTYPPQQPVLFDMKTTVKKNGKVIGSSSRPGWPWLPGDMYVPVEAFDFIPMLQKDEGRKIKGSKMNTLTASYEIILEMNVSAGQNVSGTIEPVKFMIKF